MMGRGFAILLVIACAGAAVGGRHQEITVTTHCRSHHGPSLDRLQMTTLLEAILSSCMASDAAGADPQVATLPLAIGVIGSDPETAEIDLLLLEGDDPVRELFGFRAPASWSAMGVLARGRTHGVRSSTGGRFRAEPDGCDPPWFELDARRSRRARS